MGHNFGQVAGCAAFLALQFFENRVAIVLPRCAQVLADEVAHLDQRRRNREILHGGTASQQPAADGQG